MPSPSMLMFPITATFISVKKDHSFVTIYHSHILLNILVYEPKNFIQVLEVYYREDNDYLVCGRKSLPSALNSIIEKGGVS